MKNINKVSFIGTGAWATALANVTSSNGIETVMYGIIPSEVNEINEKHTNSKYLGDIAVNPLVKATLNIEESVENADIICVAVPSIAIATVVDQIKHHLSKDVIILNVAKGFEKTTKLTMVQYIETIINKDDVFGIVSLVGPSFAEEVASKSLTAVVASSENEEAAKIIQQTFSNDWLRVYTNTDVIGASICSSLKNVIALASGILSGLDMKANPQAALITRGMAEITRFVIAMGGKPETCLGLTGIGDLVLTYTSKTSRNFQAGYMIGKYGLDYFKKNNDKTVEGIFACEIAKEIAEEKGIYAPIVCSVYNSAFLGKSPREEVYRLMKNALKSE